MLLPIQSKNPLERSPWISLIISAIFIALFALNTANGENIRLSDEFILEGDYSTDNEGCQHHKRAQAAKQTASGVALWLARLRRSRRHLRHGLPRRRLRRVCGGLLRAARAGGLSSQRDHWKSLRLIVNRLLRDGPGD